MPVIERNVVFYQNTTEVPHIILLHAFNRNWIWNITMPLTFGQFIDIVPLYRPHVHPEAYSNAVFIKICVLRKSPQHNFESKKILFVKNREGPPEAPPR